MKSLYELYITDIIGKTVQIISSLNKYNVNKRGVVTNETKNMLYLLMEKSNRIILIAKKEINLLRIYLNSREMVLKGLDLIGRPEERFLKIK